MEICDDDSRIFTPAGPGCAGDPELHHGRAVPDNVDAKDKVDHGHEDILEVDQGVPRPGSIAETADKVADGHPSKDCALHIPELATPVFREGVCRAAHEEAFENGENSGRKAYGLEASWLVPTFL